MRKIILTFITIAAIATLAYSQKAFPGFRLGLNVASFTGDSTELDKRLPRYGVTLGVLWDMYLSEDTYLQLGVGYSQQGAEFYSGYFYKGFYNKDEIVHKVDYLIFPVVWKEKWSSVYTLIGGYVGIVPLSPSSKWYKYIYYPDSISVQSGTYNSFTSNINFFDVGPVFGVGYQVKLSQQFDIFLEATYRPGMVTVNKDYSRPIYQMKNQVFSFTVGLISIGAVSRHNRFIFKR